MKKRKNKSDLDIYYNIFKDGGDTKNTSQNTTLDNSILGGIGIASSAFNNFIQPINNVDTISKAVQNTKNLNGNAFNISNNDSLMNQWNNINWQKNVSGEEMGVKGAGSITGNTLKGAAAGAAAGSVIPGIGTVIGGAVGAVASFAGGLFGNAKARRKQRELNRKIDSANKITLQNFNNTINAADTQNDLNALANFSAYGGALNSNGINWDNGLDYIPNGGIHEENPYGGIPISVDQEGKPNLVEEGEIIFDDYVFSNRLKVDNKYTKEMGLPNLKNKTFAEAAKKLSKESEERPNDPISRRGLEDSLNKLMGIQEIERLKKEKNTNTNKFSLGGNTNNINNMYDPIYDPILNNITSKPKNTFNSHFYLNDSRQEPFYTTFDNLGMEYGRHRSPLKDNSPKEILQVKNSLPKSTSKRNVLDKKTPTINNTQSLIPKVNSAKPLLDQEFNKWLDTSKYRKPLENISPKIDWTNFNNNNTEENKKLYPTWMRYAPVVGGAISVVNDLFNKKLDYSAIDNYENMIRNIGNVEPTPIGNYLQYKPFDRDYYTNKLNAQAQATRRAVENTSGGNRAAALTGILASDYNTQGKLGDLFRQAEEFNLGQRERVEAFNRGTNQYNSENNLRAQIANNEIATKKAQLMGVPLRLRQELQNQDSMTRSANLTNLFNNIGMIGRENFSRNTLNSMNSLYYNLGPKGEVIYKDEFYKLPKEEREKIKKEIKENA